MNFRVRWRWWLLTAVSALWLLWMTMRPDSTPNQINLVPLAEHGQALVCLLRGDCANTGRVFWFLFIDVLGNIAVFTPLGLGLAGCLHRSRLWPTLGRTALVGFLFSLTIELSQLAIPTRATDVDDLIFNTLGVVAGAIGFVSLQRLKLAPNRAKRIL